MPEPMNPSGVPEDLATLAREAELAYDRSAARFDWDDNRRAILAAVLPEHEREVRAKVAADLKRAAAGRRDYATRAPDHLAAELESEARVYESAAHVATDPRDVMWGLLPASMWTDADRPAERGGA